MTSIRKSAFVSARPEASSWAKACSAPGVVSGIERSVSANRSSFASRVPLPSRSKRRKTSPTVSCLLGEGEEGKVEDEEGLGEDELGKCHTTLVKCSTSII